MTTSKQVRLAGSCPHVPHMLVRLQGCCCTYLSQISAMRPTMLTTVNHLLMILPLHCFAGSAGTFVRSHPALRRKTSDGHRPPVPLPYSPRGHRLPTSPTHGIPIVHQRTSSVGRIEVSCCFQDKSVACNQGSSSCHCQPFVAVSKLVLQR